MLCSAVQIYHFPFFSMKKKLKKDRLGKMNTTLTKKHADIKNYYYFSFLLFCLAEKSMVFEFPRIPQCGCYYLQIIEDEELRHFKVTLETPVCISYMGLHKQPGHNRYGLFTALFLRSAL